MICKRAPSIIRNINDKGFTLIEVLIATVVIMVVALALGTLSSNTWSSTDLSKSYTEASVLAAQHLESLFSEKYASNKPAGMSLAVTAGPHTFTSPDGHYTVTYIVRDNDILPDTKSVQMNVSFTRGGNTKNNRFNYLLPVRK